MTEVQSKSTDMREKKIFRVTLLGSIVNILLLVVKFFAGIVGNSAAMIADAVHSLSDFLTDIVVLVFVKISSKPEDGDHDYGHGKYETLATTIIGLALLYVGIMIGKNAILNIIDFIRGEDLEQPGIIALVAALVSIIAKEWVFRKTRKVSREVDSQALEANAWHHRSDALSSIGTAVGIGGAALLGKQWAVLDPVAVLVVSAFIIFTGIKLAWHSVEELLEKSLSEEVEEKIKTITLVQEGISDVHHLRTRKMGNRIAIEMHVRMDGKTPLVEAHEAASAIERNLREEFGQNTHIMIHLEPRKTI